MPADPLLLLVYVSAATRLFDQEALLELLRVSRENNARDAITGVLLYHDGNFIQAIEGPAPAIQTLKQRIDRDPRHHLVTTLVEEQVAERQFAGWAMGFIPSAELPDADLAVFTRFIDDPASLHIDGPARSLVRITLNQFRTNLR